MKPQWTIPDDHEVAAFMALPLATRGERLCEMTPTRRTAYAVAVSKALPANHRAYKRPYVVADMFATWQQLYLNALERSYV